MERQEAEQELDLAIRTLEQVRVEFREVADIFARKKGEYLSQFEINFLAVKATKRSDDKPHTDKDAEYKANQAIGKLSTEFTVLEIQYKAKLAELDAVQSVLSGRQTQMRVTHDEDKMEGRK